jgi:hypothetical protein
MKTTMRRHIRKASEALVWYHFLPTHSEEGELWYQIFHASGAEQIGYDLDTIVARMQDRSGCLDAAARDLASVRDLIISLERSVPASIQGVIEEAYRGAFAYLCYRRGDLESADRELALALGAVHETIRSDKMLFTFSLKNLQLLTNRARVARDRRDWARAKEFLATCQKMIEDCIPLHAYGAATVYFRDVCEFYQGIEPADALDAEALEILAKPEALAGSFRTAVSAVWNALHVANDY